MTSGPMGWTVMGRALIPDISCLPTKIEDIPKEILRMYGIILDDDDGSSEEEDDINAEPGRLVIDEVSEKKVIKVNVSNKLHGKQRDEIKQAIQQFQITTSNKAQHLKHVNYCFVCKKVTSDVINHSQMHCVFEGCPELIHNDVERERHKKMHDHPTKPMQCQWCKKRYRYYAYVQRHYTFCKTKKIFAAKENWKGISRKSNKM